MFYHVKMLSFKFLALLLPTAIQILLWVCLVLPQPFYPWIIHYCLLKDFHSHYFYDLLNSCLPLQFILVISSLIPSMLQSLLDLFQLSSSKFQADSFVYVSNSFVIRFLLFSHWFPSKESQSLNYHRSCCPNHAVYHYYQCCCPYFHYYCLYPSNYY